ncbi:Uncharacterised protein [Phocoenobacter uteri]|uniref:Lipoprotein n=1 Tax=Phocoenobacter uteri TaxID=146806 RepID=A0A379C765_9PAST|nr:NF038104 family lipoprotein [Phocoenobacter uteri]SUB58061.1 Uncharacterised protein [Phocoenobacter uteri]
MKFFSKLFSILFLSFLLSGCLVVSAVDLAASAALTTAKIAVKTTGAVADAVIPDSDDEEEDK